MDAQNHCHDVCRVRPLCHCLGVTADEIRNVIEDGQLESVRQVTQACGAGGGCTACHRHIKRLIAEAAANQEMGLPVPVLGFA